VDDHAFGEAAKALANSVCQHAMAAKAAAAAAAAAAACLKILHSDASNSGGPVTSRLPHEASREQIHIAVRSSGRASTISNAVAQYQALFGEKIHVYVRADEYEVYKAALPPEVHQRLLVGAAGPGPQVRAVMMRCLTQGVADHVLFLDDNIQRFMYRGKPCTAEDLRGLLSVVLARDLKAWSINHCSNLWGVDYSSSPYKGRGLLYGPLLGLMVPRTAADIDSLNTVHGAIMDDVERSLRAITLYGYVSKFMAFTVQKAKRPGQFLAQAGGISGLFRSQDMFDRARASNLKALLREFPDLIVQASTSAGFRWVPAPTCRKLLEIDVFA
jgi:hypothetical protein